MPEETAPATYRGTLGAAIARNATEVRADRAAQIVEASRLEYRRTIENKMMHIKELESERRSQLDLSPDNSQCLISAKKFHRQAFVATRITTAVALKELRDELAVLVADYTDLFGEEPTIVL